MMEWILKSSLITPDDFGGLYNNKHNVSSESFKRKHKYSKDKNMVRSISERLKQFLLELF